MKNSILIQLCCASLLVAIHITNASAQGIMTTWVGDSTAGYSGDGGPANLALINNPYGVCFDGAGNFYIADQGNYAIRKVSASTNIITTIAGNGTPGYTGDDGPATASTLSLIYGICTDPTGNVFMTDMGNSVVREVNATSGVITTIAGTGISGYSGDGGPATAAQIAEPQGICLYSGNLYITDYTNACVRKVNLATGIITTIAGTGTNGFSGDGGPAASAMLNGPSAICANTAGDLYIADETNFVIRKISGATGIISTIAGTPGSEGYSGDDSAAVNAKIGFIDGITVDPYGNVYIDDLSCSSRKINVATGIINTMAGSGTVTGYSGDGGPATSELLSWPAGLCIDPSTGNIIIADQENNRIRRATQPGYFVPTKTNTVVAEENPLVYPNPSQGRFVIQIPDGQKFSVAEIFNVTGEKVYTTLLKDNVNSIDLAAMPGGTYMLSLQSAAGHLFTQKITIGK